MVFRWVLSAAVLLALLTSTACQVIAGLEDKTRADCADLPPDALAAGASAFSGTCLTDTGSAPDIQAVLGTGDLPIAAGGTVEDGTYYLVTATIYGGTSEASGAVPYDGPTRAVLHVSGHQILYVTQFGTDEPIAWWALLNTSADGQYWSPDPASLFDGYRCPPVACRGALPTLLPLTDERVGNRRPTFTATPTELLFIYPPYNFGVSLQAALLTFERQP